MFDADGENNISNCRFRYKVLDSDGYVVASDWYYTEKLSVGDKVKDKYYCVAYNLDPKKTYTIIIMDY